MTRRFSFPLLFASLVAMWLLLNQSVAVGQILLGAIIAAGGMRALAALLPERTRMRRPVVMLALAGVVLLDIIRSNFAVARAILNPAPRHNHAGFVHIPLELRNRYGLTVLACIITATPGTIWVVFDNDTGVLTIHVLDLLGNEQAWIAAIKSRYERRLREIFEC